MEYIEKSGNEPAKQAECVFCREAKRPDGPDNLIVARGKNAFVILNKYPYTSGHLMVVPFGHFDTLEILQAETRSEMMELTSQSMAVLRQVYRPQGFNVGMNIGVVAGAGIADHVHIHVVPRWGGDTNFMSTLGNTRVLPETLEDAFRRILAAWPK